MGLDQAVQAARFGQDQLVERYKKYEKFVPAAAFLGGTLFDIITLGRIDQLGTLVQQAIYTAMAALLILAEVRELRAPIVVPEKPAFLRKAWHYREEAAHFLLGGLLSSFTLFYFKSSSFLGALLFFIVIAGLLIGNEFSIIRSLGLSLRTAMLAVCVASYLFVVVPIAWGSIGFLQFLTALLGAAALLGIAYVLALRHLAPRDQLLKRVVFPYVGVLALFLGMYGLRLIPPVPLSLTHIGIYHGVERVSGGYKVSFEKPWWRFWENGDQAFRARPGDKIYVFFSVFSPGGFKDSVKIRWLRKDAREGWKASDAMPVAIAGGREQGWRGFAYKANYQPGDWQVRIETKDEREIGRIYLYVEPDSGTEPRAVQEKVI